MDTVRRQWTQADGPSAAVVEAVASVTGRDELDLPPLQDAVDVDALDTVVASRAATGSDGVDAVTVSFTYADVEVVVDSGGWVEARPFVTGEQ